MSVPRSRHPARQHPRPAIRRPAGAALPPSGREVTPRRTRRVARLAAAGLLAAALLAPFAATPVLAEASGQKRSAQLNAAFGLGFQVEPARPAPARPPAAPVQVIMAKPGTAAWNEACAARYHSFDPATGTYLGFDGKRYRCR